MPRNVFQIWAPVDALRAYSYPSQEPMYATPPTTVAEADMTPPVLNVQSGRRLGASEPERIVSLEAADRLASWRYIGQSVELPLAATGVGDRTKFGTDAANTR